MTDAEMIHTAVQEAIEEARKTVADLMLGERGWGPKEHLIAEVAASEAIAALRQMEAGK